MTAKEKLIAFLDKGEKKAVEFVETFRELFNEYDKGMRLFGKPFLGKFDADYSYMQSQVLQKHMSRMIDNPKPGQDQEEFSYKDQNEILQGIKNYKLEKKREYLAEIMERGNYSSG